MVIQVAQTLNRSVISTVLYRLSYTTSKRHMHSHHIQIRLLRKEHQMPHAHSLHHAPAHSPAFVSPLHLLSIRSSHTANQTPCLILASSPSTVSDRLLGITRKSPVDGIVSTNMTCTKMLRQTAIVGSPTVRVNSAQVSREKCNDRVMCLNDLQATL